MTNSESFHSERGNHPDRPHASATPYGIDGKLPDTDRTLTLDDWRTTLNQAVKLIGEKESDGAVKAAQAALEILDDIIVRPDYRRSETLEIMADAYQMGGKHLLADQYLRDCIEVRKARSPELQEKDAEIWEKIGSVNAHLEEFEQAAEAFANALEVRERLSSSPVLQLFASNLNLARCHAASGDSVRSGEYLVKAFSKVDDVPTGQYAELAWILTQIGRGYMQDGSFQDSEVLLTEAKRYFSESGVSDKSPFVVMLHGITTSQLEQEKYDSAMKSAQELVQLEVDNPAVKGSIPVSGGQMVARVYSEMGKPFKGEYELRKELAGAEEQFGKEDSKLIPYILDCANACAESFKLLEADEFLERAMQLPPSTDTEVLWRVERAQGDAFLQKGDFEEAEKHYTKALELVQNDKDVDRSDPRYVISHLQLAQLYLVQDEYGAAEEQLETAKGYASLSEAPMGNPGLAHCIHMEARLASAMGNLDQAGELLYTALEKYEKTRSLGRSFAAVPLLKEVGKYHMQLAQYDEAKEFFDRATELAEKKGRESHPMLIEVLHGLADIASNEGDLETAEKHRLSAAGIMQEIERLNDGKFLDNMLGGGDGEF